MAQNTETLHPLVVHLDPVLPKSQEVRFPLLVLPGSPPCSISCFTLGEGKKKNPVTSLLQ